MPPNGKFAQGLRGFPTPNFIPADGGYIVFRMPRDNEWSGLILGAAQLLSEAWAWYQWGDMTPEEAAEAFRVIVNEAPMNVCGGTLPGGSPPFRVNENGEIEQLVDEEWVEPEGAYELPPTPPRTEPTAEDRRCNAAANAAYVLKTLYEVLTDAFASGLTTAEAITNFVAEVALLLGAPFAEVVAPLVAIARLLFQVLYEVVEFISADLWTEEFDDKIKCYLYECSNDSGEVVHFDLPCFLDRYAAETEIDIGFAELRLFGQITYMLNFIGAQGLDAAGATTEIEGAECDDCEPGGSFCVTFDGEGDSWEIVPYPGVVCEGTVDAGFGDPAPAAYACKEQDGFWLSVKHTMDAEHTIVACSFEYYYNQNTLNPGFLVKTVDMYDDDDVLVWSFSFTPGSTQNMWETYAIPAGEYGAVRSIIVGIAVSSDDTFDGDGWIDNFCGTWID